MSQKVQTTVVLANVIQLSSDILTQVLGPEVSHKIGDEQVTAGSLKSLIKAEILRSKIAQEVGNV